MIKDEWSPRTEDSLTRTCGQPKLYNRHNHSGLRKRVVCVRNYLWNLLSPIIFLTTSHYGLVRKNCPVLLSIGQARPCLTFCNLATFLLFNPVYLNTQVKVRPNPPCMSPEPWTLQRSSISRSGLPRFLSPPARTPVWVVRMVDSPPTPAVQSQTHPPVKWVAQSLTTLLIAALDNEALF